ncbi:unnamed protein product, partial [Polarella glacialis]
KGCMEAASKSPDPPAFKSPDVPALEWLAPLGGQLSLGSTLGFCAGVALRFAGRTAVSIGEVCRDRISRCCIPACFDFISLLGAFEQEHPVFIPVARTRSNHTFCARIAAVGVGTTFCVIQGLAYRGYLQVDWRAVERDYINLLDQDGDGEVTSSDVVAVWRQTQDVLAFNLPAGMGFTAGLAYGLGANLGTSWKAALAAGVGGRLLLPRVALGGLGAIGSPAALVGFQSWWLGAADSDTRPPLRPGFCHSHFLGEPEDNCVWPKSMFPKGQSTTE